MSPCFILFSPLARHDGGAYLRSSKLSPSSPRNSSRSAMPRSRGRGHDAVDHPREFSFSLWIFVTKTPTWPGRRPPARRLRPNNLAAPILSPCHDWYPSPQPQRSLRASLYSSYGLGSAPVQKTIPPTIGHCQRLSEYYFLDNRCSWPKVKGARSAR